MKSIVVLQRPFYCVDTGVNPGGELLKQHGRLICGDTVRIRIIQLQILPQ